MHQSFRPLSTCVMCGIGEHKEQWRGWLGWEDEEDEIFIGSDQWCLEDMGDFNFIGSQQNRSAPSGNLNDMFLFNDLIDHLGIWSYLLRGDLLPCLVCNKILWWFRWIGSSLPRVGLPLTPTLLSLLWKDQLQIMCPIWWLLTLLSPRANCFSFITFG
jgi:hypothetical protein